MRLKKIAIVLMVLLTAGIIPSCWDCKDTYSTYSYVGMDVYNLDDSGPSAIMSSSGTVIKTAYGIRIDLLPGNFTSNISQLNFNLIESAYAFTCGETHYFTPENEIKEINIITLNDFDEAHPAGSEVTGYFKLSGNFETIEKFVENLSKSKYTERRFRRIDLLLMNPPTEGSSHKFKVRILLSDESILEKETNEIELI